MVDHPDKPDPTVAFTVRRSPITFKPMRGVAVAVVHVDAAADKRAEVLHFADVILQSLIVTQKILGCDGSVAVCNGVKRKPNDTTNEEYN